MASSGQHKQKDSHERNARLLKVFVVFISVCLAFALGFLIRGSEPILERLGFTSLITDVDQNPGATVSGSTYDSLSARVAEVEGIVATESLDTYDLDATTTSVLDTFTAATEDSFFRYYNPARYAAYVQESAGKYGGIGTLFSEYEGNAYVIDVFEQSTAEAAGVEEGDFVIAIDGDRSQTWTATEVINALSRDEGEEVIITWRRPASLEAQGGEEFTTTLVCSAYTTPNLAAEVIDGVGYISVKQLTQNSADLVGNAIKDLTSQGADAFVLDLRDCPGGYLTQAVDIASLFIKSGVIVEIETKEGKSARSASGKIATESPLVVIVNDRTMAAAEVLASALQDNQRATIVGATTMGKGSVQVTKSLSFGGALRYTAAYYKTPLGRDIQGSGVTPNIAVTSNPATDLDDQKEFALDTARSLIATQ